MAEVHVVRLIFTVSNQDLLNPLNWILYAYRLYDPRVLELQTLLNKDAFFPSSEFTAESVLDVLVQLGLRRSLGFSGLLDSARSVAMISKTDKIEAVRRAKALFMHLEDFKMPKASNSDDDTLPDNVNEDHAVNSDSINKASNGSGTEVRQFGNGTHLVQELEDDETESQFWLQLGSISWCPVLTTAPDNKLPWHRVLDPIVAPKLVRPQSQMWLVSATMYILDGECRSADLATKLGWKESLNASILAVQIVEISKHYAQCRKELAEGSEVLQEMNATLSREIPSIYKLLQDRVATQDLTSLKEILVGVSWVWVGDGFVSPKELAFDSPAHFHPYLHIVPTEIVQFRVLLSTFGVRETFEAIDYARVMHCIARDTKGGVLGPEQLTFCFRVLEALSEVLPVQGGSRNIVGSLLIPDSSGVLVLAKDLVYNDAPWLAKSALGMAGMRRLVHPNIENELAERLGAKSLRYLSLVDQEMTSNLPCLGTPAISEVLSETRNKDLLLFDLLEIADCCKAHKVHVMYDKREHPRQSLLQPNLGQCSVTKAKSH